MWLELKYAVRGLRESRWFSLLVVVTLALGIGTTTAFISIVDDVLLSPLPYEDSDRLVMIFQRSPGAGVEEDALSPPQFRDIVEQTTTFDELSMMTGSRLLLTREGPARHAEQLWANSSLLRMIGAEPHLGRLLTEEDDRVGAPLVVVLTHALWQSRYGANPDIVGKTIGVEHIELEVVGVLERGLILNAEIFSNNFATGRYDLVTSIPLSEERAADRTLESYRVIGKLKAGATIERAQAELDVIAARMLAENPPTIRDDSFTLEAVSLLEQTVGDVRPGLWLLMTAASVFCLIACLNTASLLLARSDSRRADVSIMTAIGATRSRILTRALGESLLLSVVGSALGLALAWSCIFAIGQLGPVNVPRLDRVAIDGSTFLTAVLLALVSSVVAGIAPALRLANVQPNAAIQNARRTRGGVDKRVGKSSVFVIAQVALAFVLLVSAALISRSFAALMEVRPGFEARGLLSIRLSQRIDSNRTPEMLLDVVRQVPGAQEVAIGGPLPFAPGAWWAPIEIDGYEAAPGEAAAIVDRRSVSHEYFEAMRIPLLAGRTFRASDLRPDARPVRVIDHILAERFWPGEVAVGKRILQTERASKPGPRPLATVVGVVEHVRHEALESDGRMTLYLPATKVDRTYLLVRSDGDVTALANPTIEAIRALDPEIAADDVRTMTARVDDAQAPRRLALTLAHVFAWLAVVLAGVGLFGLLAHQVVRGAPEIGLRMALGANESDIVRWILQHGMRVVGVGLAVGIGLAYSGSSVLASALFQVRATDAATYAVIALILAGAGAAACWIPARRASRVDPRETLRAS